MIKITLFVLATLLVLVTFSLVSADDGLKFGPDVVDLTPETFDQQVGKDKAYLTFFAAPWCGHCKNLVPEGMKLGTAAKGNSKVVIAHVNADKYGDLGSRFGVQGFPTIKFFPAGSLTPEDYNGGRDAKSFIKFLNEKANAGLFLPYEHTNTIVVNGLEQHEKVVHDKTKKITIAKYFAPWCGHCKSMAPAWDKVAQIFNKNEKTVAVVDVNADEAINRPVAEKVGVQGFPTLKYYVDGGEAQDYNGGRTVEDLVAFINEKAGTMRNAEGGLSAEAGTTPELTELAGGYLAASAADRDGLKAKIAAAVGDNEQLQWFNKIVASIAAKGDKYVETESARVTKMVEGGKLSAAKKDSLQLKLNALAAFKQ